MQVACPSCSAEYPVDERRLPASGLKMRCPKCGSRFHVHPDGRVADSDTGAKKIPKPGGFPKPGGPPKPGGAAIPAPKGLFGDGDDLDLPTPKKPPGAPSDLELDLPTPKVAKPLAPPVSDDLDLDLPAPKAEKPLAPPVSDDLDLDLPAPKAKRPLAPPVSDDLDLDLSAPKAERPLAPPVSDDLDPDLPAPKAERPLAPPVSDDLDLDLPAPKAKRPLAPPVSDDLDPDLPAPKAKRPLAPPVSDDLDPDLPAPKAARAAPNRDDLDLPAPKKPATAPGDDFDLDLPAPRSNAPAADDVDADLPAPYAEKRSALADSGSPFDDLDLPAAKSAHDLPKLKGFGGTDLPQPKTRSVLEQADEAFGDLDLPMPKAAESGGGFDDLDLPMPKADADLPAAKGDDFVDLDLPTPRRTPSPAAEAAGFGDLDLPTPRDVTDLPAPAELADLPATSEGVDLPVTAQSADLPVAKDFADDDLALPEPRADAHGGAGDGAGLGGTGFGELDLGGETGGDDMEFADIPQEGGDGARESLPPVRMAAPKEKTKGKQAPVRKSRAALIALGVLVVLLGAGAALGATPYGIFGINLLEPFLPGAGDPAQVRAAISQAEEEAASDRWIDVRTSLHTLGRARHGAGLNRQLLSRSLLHEALFQVRFADSASAARASAIRSRMQERGMEGPEFALARAADALAQGDSTAARRALGQALGAAGSDPYVHLVSGEIELAEGELDLAAEAFATSAEGGTGPRGLWGVARARLRGGDTHAALAAIDAVLEASPSHGEALVARARLLLANGDADAALAIAERAAGQTEEAIRAAPLARAQAWTLIGEVQEQRGRMSLANHAYEQAVLAIDAHIPALLGAGRVLLSDSRPADALPRFESVLHAEGADAQTLPNGRSARQEATLGAARAMMSLDRVQEAKANLEALAEERSEDAEVALWLGKAEEALDPPNRAAAEQHYRDAIQVAPDMFPAYLALAELFLATDRGADVGPVLEQAVSRVDVTAEMRYQLGEFELRRNRFPAAIRELRRALALDAELPGALFSLGVAQRRSGHLTEAARAFDRLAEIDDRHIGLSLERGLLYEARGESERAVAAYEAALEGEPDDLDLLLRLGAAQVAADRIDDAEETLERVRQARPNSAEANHFVGRVAFARGQYAESLAHFRRAIALDPVRGEFHLYVGWAAFENGQLAEALAGVNDAIERDPSLGDAYWIRGRVKLRSGHPLDALEDLERAIQLRPSRYEIYATMGETYDQLPHRFQNQAIDAYRRAVSHVDDNGEWFYELASLLLNRAGRGDSAEAATALQRATLLGDAMSPTPVRWLPDAHRLRGMVLQAAGRDSDAVPHYRRYLEIASHGHIDYQEVRNRLMDLGVVPE